MKIFKKLMLSVLAAVLVLTAMPSTTAEAASMGKYVLYGHAKNEGSKGINLTNGVGLSEGVVAYQNSFNTKEGFTAGVKVKTERAFDCFWVCFTPEVGSLGMMGLKRDNRRFNALDVAAELSSDATTSSSGLGKSRASIVQGSIYKDYPASKNIKSVNDGKWHDLKVTYASKKLYVYYDGKLTASSKVDMADKVYLTFSATCNRDQHQLAKVWMKDAYLEMGALSFDKFQVNLSVNQKVKLRCKPTAPLKGKAIKWTSSDAKIAKVSSKGEVLAKKIGYCKITASVGKISQSVDVFVMPKKISGLKKSASSGNISFKWAAQSGAKYKVSVTKYDSDFGEYEPYKTAFVSKNSYDLKNAPKGKYKVKVTGYIEANGKKVYGPSSDFISFSK